MSGYSNIKMETQVTPCEVNRSKSWNPEDSGYYTNTPRSCKRIKSTGHSADYSSILDFNGELSEEYKNQHFFTPVHIVAPVSRFDLTKAINETYSISSHTLFCNATQQSSTKMDVQAFPTEFSLKKGTKRDFNSMDANMSSPKLGCYDLSVTDKLQSLAMSDEGSKRKKPRLSNVLRDTTNIDISSITSEPSTSDSDYFTQSYFSDSSKQISYSYPNTPVKTTRRKALRYKNDSRVCLELEKTPEKVQTSSFLKCESGPRCAKALNFSHSSSLATPEKNKILYSNLIPVSPPKLPRSPSKAQRSPKRKYIQERRPCLAGREKVDFLKMLGEMQKIEPPLKIIFGNLTGEDISRMCVVSKTWAAICKKDKDANTKRKAYIDAYRLTKENRNAKMNVKVKTNSVSLDSKAPPRTFKECNNQMNIIQVQPKMAVERSPPVSPSRRRHKKFIKVGASCKSGNLTKCPKCDEAAGVTKETTGETWAGCSSQRCLFAFCTSCRCSRHAGNKCPQAALEPVSPSKPKKITRACSKESRKNLRRLISLR